ncbi:MAG TPA: AraC family transcriptional regulator [Puia sp.]|jgi:AraC-like DNA-binding protein|nr:AraC family transcriptional regulator [Puia sp.]
MVNQSTFTLVNPQNGNLAFKLFFFEDNSFFDHIQRQSHFSLIWVMEGKGKLKVDLNEYDFGAQPLFTFSPYQAYMFETNKPLKGIAIYFHPEFFCIYKHHKEVSSNGVLFNNVYQPPFVQIDESSAMTFQMLCEQIKNEMQNPGLAQYELLVSYLKIFLITAARLKTQQQPEAAKALNSSKEPFILQKLKDAIEENFKIKHSPADYAGLLYISPKTLAKITKTHFNKTLTALIADRIIIEAKRELYLTNKSVKEIAYELGYPDEYYFSRFFKINAGASPQLYRETVGFAKGVTDGPVNIKHL